eukprot:TRINITY_DN271_c0_g1_i2.p2 TRINITY_DN271_c0_g1~~TRINITY_DN271_c0_g1_i2.p2  ORF type:complete len:101 (-),score=3.64 TRINITY_DN271_c0_g1_i2:62-364(-)
MCIRDSLISLYKEICLLLHQTIKDLRSRDCIAYYKSKSDPGYQISKPELTHENFKLETRTLMEIVSNLGICKEFKSIVTEVVLISVHLNDALIHLSLIHI